MAPIRPRSATINAAGVFTPTFTVMDGCDVFFEDTDFHGELWRLLYLM